MAKGSVLIVDDDPSALELTEFLLRNSGYTTHTVTGAREALRYLGATGSGQAAGGGIDLVLMDLMMPELDGLEACRRIGQTEGLEDLPIIVVTARTDAKGLEESFMAGAIDFLTKPVGSTELLARVRSALKLKHEMDRRKARERELAKKNQELQQALAEVKVLRGFIPICASCKKVRDDRGYWQQVEAYISEHSEAQFSHGLCPDCVGEYFPHRGGPRSE